MSYYISLYMKSFLRHTLESGLGDWTGADPIPEAAVSALVAAAEATGFRPADPDPEFVASLREGCSTPAVEFTLDTSRNCTSTAANSRSLSRILNERMLPSSSAAGS